MGFDAGALFFKIQAVGAQLFKADMRDSKTAIEGVEQASTKAKGASDELGKSSDGVAEKARKTKAPLDEQAKSTKGAGDESEKASRKQDEQAASAERQREAAQKLAAVLVGVGLAISAAVGLSVAKFTEFDAQMSNTSAATMATAQEQRELADAALEAGADTAYSATEAAAAQEELAKAGQSVADITGGSLKGSLALAAAGQLEVARSAEIMATTLTQFRLPASEAARVADVLAAGAGKAQGSVEDLALGLSYVGPLAASMGWSLEETAGTLAYFSTQGIVGEKAGTGLRSVLAALQAPSAAAAKVMGEYGIQMFNANGEMISAAEVAEQLRTKLSGLTQEERLAALGRIFGNEALSAATLLYEGGAQAVTTWTGRLQDEAYATEQAAKRTDNLAGDLERLGGAFDSALIQAGSGANGVLRETVQSMTFLVDVFGDADEPIQATVLGLGVAAAAALLLAGATLSVRTRWVEWRTTLELTNGQMARSALLAGAMGIALSGVLTVIALVVARQAEMAAGTAAFEETLDDATGAVTENTRAMIAKKLADQGVFEQAEKAGYSQKQLTDALYEGGDAAQAAIDAFKAASFATGGFDVGLQNASRAVDDMNTQVGDSRKRHEDLKAATEGSTGANEDAAEGAQTAAGAYLEAADGAESLEGELRRLIDTVMESNGVGQDAVSANLDYQDALAKVDETIQKAREGQEGYSLTLDTGTQAGRDNLGMLNDLASSSQNAADKQFALDGNTQNYRSSLDAGRQALIDRATDLGMNADQASALADQIYRIPTEREVEVIAKTQAAAEKARDFANLWESIRNKTVTLTMIGSTQINGAPAPRVGPLLGSYGFGELENANGNVIEAYAGGGIRYENHVAQMARAGAMRVWAEPETMGETYVPHAEAKRARSEQLMAETAALFGGMYTSRAAIQAAASAPQTAASRERPIVNQYITTQHPDPRIQMRMMADEAARAFGSTF